MKLNWDLKNRLPEAAVGGATGLVVVAIYIIGRATLQGATDGEWLNFAGVIVGVMLTAGITIGLQRYAEARSFQPLRDRTLFSIKELERSTGQFLIGDDHGQMDADYRALQLHVEYIAKVDWKKAERLLRLLNTWDIGRQAALIRGGGLTVDGVPARIEMMSESLDEMLRLFR